MVDDRFLDLALLNITSGKLNRQRGSDNALTPIVFHNIIIIILSSNRLLLLTSDDVIGVFFLAFTNGGYLEGLMDNIAMCGSSYILY